MCTARAREGHFGAKSHPYVGRDKIFRKKQARDNRNTIWALIVFQLQEAKKQFFIENLLENEAPEKSARLRVANNNIYLEQ